MKHPSHFKKNVLMLILVGLATLARAGAASSTLGDSASLEGTSATVETNALDPTGSGQTLPDVNGLGPYRLPVVPAPNGELYSVPRPEADTAKTLTGDLEIGGMYTSGDNGGARGSSKFNEYRDMSNGVFINQFDFSSTNGNAYINSEGGGVARTDQYYDLQFGQSDDWSIRGSFDQDDDHVHSETTRPPNLEGGNESER
jgi:hypothetical protein